MYKNILDFEEDNNSNKILNDISFNTDNNEIIDENDKDNVNETKIENKINYQDDNEYITI